MIALRPPQRGEAQALTELCLRSKAVHGYDAAFIAMCRAELTVRPDRPGHEIVVAENDGKVVGMAEISIGGDEAELEKIFVEPGVIGTGVGRALFDWARLRAVEKGAIQLSWDADPGAVPFYRAMGAVEVGRSPSGSIPGRFLPRLRLDLGPVAAA